MLVLKAHILGKVPAVSCSRAVQSSRALWSVHSTRSMQQRDFSGRFQLVQVAAPYLPLQCWSIPFINLYLAAYLHLAAPGLCRAAER